MAFVQFSKVSLAFGDRDILKDVSLNLSAGSRAALAGANGAGKSTLMKVIAGKIDADSGERAVQKGCRVSYLPQSGIVHSGKTLRDEAETAYDETLLRIAKMEELGRELEKSSGAAADTGRTRVLIEEHHRLHEEIENSGYYRRDADIARVLAGLGFSPADTERQTEEFSGGWQMRIALAKVLLENPDILLLDEPTNYLDIEARAWLESWLASFGGGCLLVSHDRYFLDTVVNEVYEVFGGNLKRYAGNYSVYEKLRAAEIESLVKRYEAQREEIEKTEALIRRFRYKATKAAFAQELIKRLEKMEIIEIPENLKKINITFPQPPHSGRVALTLEGIGKSYGARRVLAGLDLSLEAGEKLLVAGPNGAGKTTLLRIISGADSAHEGSVKYGAGIASGYFSQDAAENLTGSQTVAGYIETQTPTHLIPRVRDMLGAFLFRGDDVFKTLSVLSGGEKSRLALLRMLLKPMNLLILDEPTNHLDLQSKDILLDCLKNFAGTVIFVSHDRGFMEALSTKTLELKPGSHRLFYGNYAYYLDRAEREGGSLPPGSSRSASYATPLSGGRRPVKLPSSGKSIGAPDAAEHRNNALDVSRGLPVAPATPPENSLSFAEQNSELNRASRDSAAFPAIELIKAGTSAPLSAAERREQEKTRQTLIRRLERRDAELLAAVGELEKEKNRLEAELALPEVYSSGEKARAVKSKLEETAKTLEEKTREWEANAGELARTSGP